MDLKTLLEDSLRLLQLEQLKALSNQKDDHALSGELLHLFTLPQLMELGARTAMQGLRARHIRFLVSDKDIDLGQLEYKLEGNLSYLVVIAEEMAEKGVSEIERQSEFHQTSAVISGAQMLAHALGREEAEPLLLKGQQLSNYELGSRQRAEKTKEFLDELFSYIDRKMAPTKS